MGKYYARDCIKLQITETNLLVLFISVTTSLKFLTQIETEAGVEGAVIAVIKIRLIWETERANSASLRAYNLLYS